VTRGESFWGAGQDRHAEVRQIQKSTKSCSIIWRGCPCTVYWSRTDELGLGPNSLSALGLQGKVRMKAGIKTVPLTTRWGGEEA